MLGNAKAGVHLLVADMTLTRLERYGAPRLREHLGGDRWVWRR